MASPAPSLLASQWQSQTWQPPSLVEAMAYGRDSVFGGGALPLWRTAIRQFNPLGPGVSLYFRAVKALAIIFTALSLLSLPAMLLMNGGSSLLDDDMDPLKLARLSLANIGVARSNVALVGSAVTVTPSRLDPGSTSSLSWYDAAHAIGSNTTVTVWRDLPYTRLSARAVAVILCVCDVVTVLLLLFFVSLLRRTLDYHAGKLDASVISPPDFTIMVTGLPADATEDEVRLHFNNRYNLYAPDWTYESAWWKCFVRRKMAPRPQFHPSAMMPQASGGGLEVSQPAVAVAAPVATRSDAPVMAEIHRANKPYADVYPVLDARNSGNASCLYGWVADVVLARRNGWLIRRYQAQLSLLERIVEARATVLRVMQRHAAAPPHTAHGAPSPPPLSPAAVAERQRVLGRLTKLEERLERVHRRHLEAYSSDAVAAFVTFQHEISIRRCLADYDGSSSLLGLSSYWLQPPVLRFRGRHRLVVERASDPTSIIWQNLELGTRARCLRSTGVNAIVLLVLILSFALSVFATGQLNALRTRIPSNRVCSSLMPAVTFNASVMMDGTVAPWSAIPPDWTATLSSPAAGCPVRAVTTISGARRTSPSVRVRAISRSGSPLPVTAMNASNACYDECIRDLPCTIQAAPIPPYTLPVNMTFPTSLFQRCYCFLRLTSDLATQPLISVAQNYPSHESSACATLLTDSITFNGFAIGSSVVIVVINVLLRSLLAHIASWEGHHTLESLHASIAVKVFVSLFINTAIIAILIYAALPPPVASVQVGNITLFDGTFSSFTGSWHVLVGAGNIVFTMVINTVTPHIPNVATLCLLPCRTSNRGILDGPRPASCLPRMCRPRHVRDYVTQGTLNKVFEPPEFELPTRMALLLFALYTCLMFSGGHPVLMLVAAGSFWLTYWVDKASLLRFAHKPPAYGSDLITLFMRLLSLAVVLHLVTTIWMYSDPTVLYSPTMFAADPVRGPDGSSLRRTADNIVAFFAWAASSDTSGFFIVQRITRENTLPLMAILALFVVIKFVVSRSLLTALFKCTRQSLVCLSGGRCCVQKAVSEDDAGADEMHCNPPFTGPYALHVDVTLKQDLSTREVLDGWRLVSDPFGRVFRVRTCPNDVTLFGAQHAKGDLLLTWEVLALQGYIVSYDIIANPVYAPAVAAMELGRRQAELEKTVAGRGLARTATFINVGGAVRATQDAGASQLRGGGSSAMLGRKAKAAADAIRHASSRDLLATLIDDDDDSDEEEVAAVAVAVDGLGLGLSAAADGKVSSPPGSAAGTATMRHTPKPQPPATTTESAAVTAVTGKSRRKHRKGSTTGGARDSVAAATSTHPTVSTAELDVTGPSGGEAASPIGRMPGRRHKRPRSSKADRRDPGGAAAGGVDEMEPLPEAPRLDGGALGNLGFGAGMMGGLGLEGLDALFDDEHGGVMVGAATRVHAQPRAVSSRNTAAPTHAAAPAHAAGASGGGGGGGDSAARKSRRSGRERDRPRDEDDDEALRRRRRESLGAYRALRGSISVPLPDELVVRAPDAAMLARVNEAAEVDLAAAGVRRRRRPPPADAGDDDRRHGHDGLAGLRSPTHRHLDVDAVAVGGVGDGDGGRLDERGRRRRDRSGRSPAPVYAAVDGDGGDGDERGRRPRERDRDRDRGDGRPAQRDRSRAPPIAVDLDDGPPLIAARGLAATVSPTEATRTNPLASAASTKHSHKRDRDRDRDPDRRDGGAEDGGASRHERHRGRRDESAGAAGGDDDGDAGPKASSHTRHRRHHRRDSDTAADDGAGTGMSRDKPILPVPPAAVAGAITGTVNPPTKLIRFGPVASSSPPASSSPRAGIPASPTVPPLPLAAMGIGGGAAVAARAPPPPPARLPVRSAAAAPAPAPARLARAVGAGGDWAMDLDIDAANFG